LARHFRNYQRSAHQRPFLLRALCVPDRASSACARLLIASAMILSRCVERCW